MLIKSNEQLDECIFLTFVFIAFIFAACQRSDKEKRTSFQDSGPLHHIWCGCLWNASLLGSNLHSNCWLVHPARLLWCVREVELLPAAVLPLCSQPGAAPSLHGALPNHRLTGPQGTPVLHSQPEPTQSYAQKTSSGDGQIIVRFVSLSMTWTEILKWSLFICPV